MTAPGASSGSWDECVDRSLVPAWFSVQADLAKLDQVLQVGAVEAAVLYAARLLDVLAAAAVRLLGLSPGPNVYDNLQLLEQFGLPPRTTRYWAHGLRRIGNEARHLHRPIHDDDALLARALLERWLDWFFCRFTLGPRLAKLPAALLPREDEVQLRKLVLELDQEESSAAQVAAGKAAARSRAQPEVRGSEAAGLLAAIVVAEMLLDRADPAAQAVLDDACTRDPDNVRLRQLRALALSRSDRLQQAIDELEPLLKESPDDPETQGILAGAYKRMAQRSGEREWLEKAHRLYWKGWNRSRSTNTYLGINAAATALWLDRHALARETALAVEQHLSRAARFDIASDVWAAATLAEAKLILGHLAQARELYETTFVTHAIRADAVHIARRQAERILESLGIAPDAFWASTATSDLAGSLRIGVTGHRAWLDDDSLEARVESQLRQIQAEHPGTAWTIITGLAEGADRLLLRLAQRQFPDATWIAVLPLEVSEYLADFPTKASRSEFRTLVSQSQRIDFPRQRFANRPAAYADCGRRIVESCDVLIALWDGEPARGPGGTAEVVDYAQSINRPVRIVNVRR